MVTMQLAALRAVSQQCHKANSAQRTPVIGHLGDMRTLAACVHMPDSDSRVEVDVHQTGRSIIAISFAAKFIIEISTSERFADVYVYMKEMKRRIRTQCG